MKQKISVSIGIPAYNEAANIGQLLTQVYDQAQTNFELERVVVISDASTDETVQVAEQIQQPSLTVIQKQKRKGVATRQNDLFELLGSEIIIILNADTQLLQENIIEKLVEAFLSHQKVGIVCGRVVPTTSKSLVGKALDWHSLWKTQLYESLGYDNIYLCHGRMRAFSKAFAKQFSWPTDIISEDAYSYLACKQLGYQFVFQPEAAVAFKSPEKLADHIKQSARFITIKEQLAAYLDAEIIETAFRIPRKELLIQMILGVTKHPVFSLLYAYLLASAYIETRKSNRLMQHAWPASTTTKVFINK